MLLAVTNSPGWMGGWMNRSETIQRLRERDGKREIDTEREREREREREA